MLVHMFDEPPWGGDNLQHGEKDANRKLLTAFLGFTIMHFLSHKLM